jgi:broad specificity polyphosphatase/5'/3'-nucleotidase SurE
MGKPIWEDSGDETLDTDATMAGYITITPMTIDRTNWDVFRHLNGK